VLGCGPSRRQQHDKRCLVEEPAGQESEAAAREALRRQWLHGRLPPQRQRRPPALLIVHTAQEAVRPQEDEW
jgi:hypothetical protein